MKNESSELREPVPPPARVIAACFAACAFSIAIVAGIFAANPTTTILARALVSLFGAYLLGLLGGELLAFAIRDHLRQYFAENPIPNSEQSVNDLVCELRVDKLPKPKPNMADSAAGQ